MTQDEKDQAIDVASTALAVQQPHQASVALFGSTDPVEVIEKAVKVADALKSVIASKGLVKNIQGREYVEIAGWQTLAAMLRLTSVCEWSRPLENGFEARVLVQSPEGSIIGSAEAQCTREERTWKNRDDYALRSMAQTRATAKALRSVLGFVVVLAGYKDTPAEEMPGEEAASGAQARSASTGGRREVHDPTDPLEGQGTPHGTLQEIIKAKSSINALIGKAPEMAPFEVEECLASVLGANPDLASVQDIPTLRAVYNALLTRRKAVENEVPM